METDAGYGLYFGNDKILTQALVTFCCLVVVLNVGFNANMLVVTTLTYIKSMYCNSMYI